MITKILNTRGENYNSTYLRRTFSRILPQNLVEYSTNKSRLRCSVAIEISDFNTGIQMLKTRIGTSEIGKLFMAQLMKGSCLQ